MNQETTHIGGTLCRIYWVEGGRFATVNPQGNVFGYPNGGAFTDGESDYEVWGTRPTNSANELAMAYVLGGK